MQFIDSLIRKRATGNLTAFAERTNLSKSTLKEYRREMKDLGFPINFCRSEQTYFYEENGGMVDHLFRKNINEKE